MAKIGLIDVDQTSFPNIALGKIARYHKVAGDEVEWVDPLFGGGYDKVYMSKIFTSNKRTVKGYKAEYYEAAME